VLQPAARAAGLGRVTWHQFRHIHSSLLNDLRVPVKIAQEQLGHASITTTLNIYTHVVDASHRKAVEEPLFVDSNSKRGAAASRERWLATRSSNRAYRQPPSPRLRGHPSREVVSEGWRRRPDLNRGWKFCRLSKDLCC
jgi:hypothetical protein